MKKLIVLISIVALMLFVVGCGTKNDDGLAQNAVGDTSQPQEMPLKDLFMNKLARYTVDYDVTLQDKNMTMRLSMDGMRFAQVAKMHDSISKSVYDGESFVSCINMNNVWDCYRMPIDKPSTSKIEDDVNEGAEYSFIGDCLVAGEKGFKYAITLKDMPGNTTICYSREGILLEMVTKDMTMKATKVQKVVDQDMFVVPSTPKDISSLIPQ